MFVHAPEIRLQALALVEQGVNDCEIARRLGVPRPTVRDWRKPHYMARHTATCPRCWRRSPPVVLGPQDYAELLGLYLGDGHITAMPRTQRLRLFLDNSYPSIVAETEALLRRAFPHNHVSSHSGTAGR